MEFSLIIILVFSVILHELGHGYSALWLGDTTARDRGRLTLNPIPHIDLFFTIILPAVLIAMEMPPFGGAKGVPVSPTRFRNVSPRRGMMLVGVAGPMVNLALGATALAGLHMWHMSASDFSIKILLYVFLINMNLMVFNMLPFPPLDGSRVLAGLVSKNWAMLIYRFERVGLVFVLIMVLMGWLDPFFRNWMKFLHGLLPLGLGFEVV